MVDMTLCNIPMIRICETYIECSYSYIQNIGIPKHKKHLLLSSGTKLFITFELKAIRHKKSDTHSFYAGFSICPPPPPLRAAPRRKLLV